MRKNSYWILTSLLCAWLGFAGVFDVIRAPQTRAIMQTLHYPDYLLLILGCAKLLAVAALLYPGSRKLREWAYAGIVFDGCGAFLSHLAVQDTVPNTLAPLIFVGLAVCGYLCRPREMRLVPMERGMADHPPKSANAGN